MDLLLDAICVVDAEGRFVYVSAASERIFGYTPAELIGMPMIDLVYPDDRDSTLATAREVMTGQRKNHFENRYVRKDGQIVHIMWSANWSADEQLRVAVAHDITDRKHDEAMQAAVYAISEAAFSAEDLGSLLGQIHQIVAALLPVSLFCVALKDQHEGTLSFPYHADRNTPGCALASPSARAISAEIIGSGKAVLLTPDTTAEGPPSLPTLDRQSLNWLGVPLLSQHATFGALVIQNRGSVPGYSLKNKELLQFVSTQIATAIQRIQMQSRLQLLSHYDQLTGLPNRTLLYERMDRALLRARRVQGRGALLYMDLDKFKQVNDSFGHGTGDLLLQAVADRLRHCVRESDTVSRIGGDEFVVLLEDIAHAEHAQAIAEKIRTALNQAFELGQHKLKMIPSIGIALYPQHGEEHRILLEMADKAMYLAKNGGGNRTELAPLPQA